MITVGMITAKDPSSVHGRDVNWLTFGDLEQSAVDDGAHPLPPPVAPHIPIRGYVYETVARVIYAGRQRGKARRRARAVPPGGWGALLGFARNGGLDAGRRFIDNLRMFHHVATIANARSLAIHPATTTHFQCAEIERSATGVTEGYIRLSIGIEHPDDIVADLGQALAAV